MPTSIKWIFLFLAWPLLTTAQFQVTHPMARLVVQRGADGNGRLYLSGRLTSSVDRVEARLTPVSAGQGTDTGWQTVQSSPANNVFLGYITSSGGWYVLTVRTMVGNVAAAQATVQPIGIGEVFITAGQSNARGLGIGDNDLGTATDRVNAIDSINHSYPPGAQALVSSGDPMPVPVFKALTATRRVFPMAESSWGWGELGDYVVNRYNVPVAFYVAGWDASTVENWINTANGIPACNRYYCVENWPNLQPYTNLRNVLTYYASLAGVRAVLWHQGEAEYGDATSGSIPDYANRLTSLIQKSRQDFGGRNVPWVVARASFDGSTTRPDVVTKQEQVISTAGLNVFQGPLNDTIINRNAGSTDVHFRNASRVASPAYYLNQTGIPQEMGLSRFARNWNNSLNNTFFQNSIPITPTQFAVTNTLAEYVLPGANLSVSFTTLGTFNADNQWQVQLLDSVGHYQAILGSGSTSPIQIALPGNYQSGHYQIRVVSTSPAMPAVPSNLFQITTQPPLADLSLTMAVSQRTLSVNNPLTLTLTVKNSGPGRATNIIVRDRIPDNLAFISGSGLSANGSVLMGTVPSLDAGASTAITFVAQPTAGGTYRNAAEIAQSDVTDPDSQPNSGTGDGQDDAAQVDFRTTGSGFYESPNPNQVPLPAVISNQPTPDPNKADVSLSLSVSNRAPQLGDVITYALTVRNLGGLTATNIGITAYLPSPSSQTFVPGDDLTLSSGNLTATISNIAAGGTVTLRFRTQATTLGQSNCTAEITSAGTPDPDSTPGNGTANGEDDTAQIDVRVR